MVVRQSLNVPEYMFQHLSRGVNALIRAGQVIATIGKLRANVGIKNASATSIGNMPKDESCQSM